MADDRVALAAAAAVVLAPVVLAARRGDRKARQRLEDSLGEAARELVAEGVFSQREIAAATVAIAEMEGIDPPLEPLPPH